MSLAVYITSSSLLSPAGIGVSEHLLALGSKATPLTESPLVGPQVDRRLEQLRADHKALRGADRTVLLGVMAAQDALAGLPEGILNKETLGVIVGTSRGTSALWELEHERFIDQGRVSLLTSPQTTGGISSSALARFLGAQGPSLTVSATCTSGLQALGVGFSFLHSGACTKVLVGAAEAPVTPFNLAILGVLGVLAEGPSELHASLPYPCRPFHPKRSGMVLTEGAAALFLEAAPAGNKPPAHAKARVLGFAATTESEGSLAGVSKNAEGLGAAIKKAIKSAGLLPQDIDLLIGHGTGTYLGDAAEMSAYHALFEQNMPYFYTHKWLLGHSLGASALCSTVLALGHLEAQSLPPLPYFLDAPSVLKIPDASNLRDQKTRPIKTVLITAMGFGGSSAALLLGAV